MNVLEHIPQSGALGLAVLFAAVGCGQEATAPHQRAAIAMQAVSGSSQSRGVVARFHDHVTESIPPDAGLEICGIPAGLDYVATDNFFLLADGSFKDAASVMLTFTNLNGRAVVVSSAGQITDQAIVDEVARTVTFVTSYKGLPQKVQTAKGPVLLRDAGIISFAIRFNLDTGDLISSEVTVNKGPHPDAHSDFTRFCEVVVPALS